MCPQLWGYLLVTIWKPLPLSCAIESGGGTSIQSTWPLRRAASRVVGSGMGSSTTLSTFGVRFGSQYDLFASSSSRSRGTNRVALNGPVPDGCSANLRQSLTLFHCAGDTITMYTIWYGTKLVTVGVSSSIV